MLTSYPFFFSPRSPMNASDIVTTSFWRIYFYFSLLFPSFPLTEGDVCHDTCHTRPYANISLFLFKFRPDPVLIVRARLLFPVYPSFFSYFSFFSMPPAATDYVAN